MPLAKAPKELRTAATLALISSSISKIVTLIIATVIIATLPTWVPGLLAYQPIPIGLLVVLIGSSTLSRRASKIKIRVGQQRLEDARSSSLIGMILSIIVGGILPFPFYLLLYMSLGKAMIKRAPTEAQLMTVYIPPQPSGGVFLGRYLGWLSMYLYILYIGYTQLPDGLKGASDWLSPTFGIHFNTLIVAAYLVLSNPITNPAILWSWITAGLVGGLIAGGKTGRGVSVGMTAFFSTLGAMGLAALVIFRGFYASISSLSIPPFPPGFSITALASGPIAQDLIPVLLKPGVSPSDPAVIENVALILVRNMGLILMTVTLAGRAGCLIWQGIVSLLKPVARAFQHPSKKHTQQVAKKQEVTVETPANIKTGLVLLMLSAGLILPVLAHASTPGQVLHVNGPSQPYQQYLTVGLDKLGAPNASLRLANLDLSNTGLVLDSNYDQANFTMLIINNDYPEGFGNGAKNFPLQLFSKPALITMYSSPDQSTALSKSNNVAAQFSTALGTQFTYALSLPMGNNGWINLYATDPSISNSDMLAKALAILPAGGFSGLFNQATISGQKYSALLGLIPGNIGNVALSRSFGFMLNTEWPRQYYKEGPHQFSLAGLLGATSNISGTAQSNSSIVAVNFQPGTIVSSYAPVSLNTYYDAASHTLFLNATSTFTTPDLTASFTYAFAPNIVFEKTANPSSGTVGDTYAVTLSVQNLDNVPVSMVNLTDPQSSSVYGGTLSFVPSGTQRIQVATLSPGQSLSTSYQATPTSSGAYSLSVANGELVWTLPNGTSVAYTANTDQPVLHSQSGPMVQIVHTFNDFLPYSYLLILGFVLPPIVETVRMLRRRSKPKQVTPVSGNL